MASPEDLDRSALDASALPPLPEGAPSAARSFHRHAEVELERRRTTDPDFHPDRFRRAVSLVLTRLGVAQAPRLLTKAEGGP